MGSVEVPEAVAQECHVALPDWIQVHAVQNQPLVQSLKLELGAGEAEAIALSLELSAARLILDDRKARRMARQLNAPVTGTLAILVRAKDQDVISEVRAVIDALQTANFRISSVLIEEALRKAGESSGPT